MIALGFEELAEYGFDSALLFVVPAGAYLVVSVLSVAMLRFDELVRHDDGPDGGDGPRPTTATPLARATLDALGVT